MIQESLIKKSKQRFKMPQRIYIHDEFTMLGFLCGGIFDAWFQLDYDTRTTNLACEKALKDKRDGPEIRKHINSGNLRLDIFDQDNLLKISKYNRYSTISLSDAAIIHLTKQTSCIVLTDDLHVMNLLKKEKILVKGLSWVLDEIMENNVMILSSAFLALKKMRQVGCLSQSDYDNKKLKWAKEYA